MPEEDPDDRHGGRDRRALTPGQLAYLQLPAQDIGRSAAFYQGVFGWEADAGSAAFEAPGLIGQWTLDRAAAAGAGPLLWLHVDHLGATLERVEALGGRIETPPFPDGPVRTLAVIVDPGGNAVGLAEHRRGT